MADDHERIGGDRQLLVSRSDLQEAAFDVIVEIEWHG
jgi:hypothetical protein